MITSFSPYKSPFPAGVKLPEIRVDQKYYDLLGCQSSISNFNFLRKLCFEGVKKRKIDELANKQVYYERLTMELSILNELGFVDYILLNWDVINYCHENKIPVGAGRGCFVAGSQVTMADGSFKNIEDVKIGDLVIDHERDARRVSDTLANDIDEEIIYLQLENGLVIKCTKDHKYFTENRGWVEAKDLTDKDDIREIIADPRLNLV